MCCHGYLPNSTSDRVKTISALFLKETEGTSGPGREVIARVTNRAEFDQQRLRSPLGYTPSADSLRTQCMPWPSMGRYAGSILRRSLSAGSVE